MDIIADGVWVACAHRGRLRNVRMTGMAIKPVLIKRRRAG
jgi:hypothetical protein